MIFLGKMFWKKACKLYWKNYLYFEHQKHLYSKSCQNLRSTNTELLELFIVQLIMTIAVFCLQRIVILIGCSSIFISLPLLKVGQLKPLKRNDLFKVKHWKRNFLPLFNYWRRVLLSQLWTLLVNSTCSKEIQVRAKVEATTHLTCSKQWLLWP